MQGIKAEPFQMTGLKTESLVDEMGLHGVPYSLMLCSQCGAEDFTKCNCPPLQIPRPKVSAWSRLKRRVG